MKLPQHLFVSSVDGALHDTRIANWHERRPLRAKYERHHSEINSLADLKSTLRAGRFEWPGGYPLYFIASDGEALSFEAVRENWRECCQAWLDRRSAGNGWRIIACEVNYEDSELVCAHSGKPIESAYGDSK